MSKLSFRFWDQEKNINFHLQKSGGYDCSLETGGGELQDLPGMIFALVLSFYWASVYTG
jgi:hypothetical protein